MKTTITQKIFLYQGTIEQSKSVIRFYTKYFKYPDSEKVKYDDDIAQLYVLTQKNSYYTKLKRKHINKQLSWNYELMARIQNALSGTNQYLIIGMEDSSFGNKILSVCTQLQTKAIRIGLFQVEIQNIHQEPFQVMRNLMGIFHKEKKNIITQLSKRQQQEQNQLNKIQLTYKKLIQDHNDQLSIMKDKFLLVLNQAKKKLKKVYGLQIANNQITNEQKDNEIYQRQIYKIKVPRKYLNNTEQDTNEQLLNLLN